MRGLEKSVNLVGGSDTTTGHTARCAGNAGFIVNHRADHSKYEKRPLEETDQHLSISSAAPRQNQQLLYLVIDTAFIRGKHLFAHCR